MRFTKYKTIRHEDNFMGRWEDEYGGTFGEGGGFPKKVGIGSGLASL